MTNKRTCEWGDCDRPIWSPYSWSYCPRHYATHSKRRKDTARARLCFRLTIYGPKNERGEKWWKPSYPDYAEILVGAAILGVDPQEDDALSWKALLMDKIDPDSRKVITDAGRTRTFVDETDCESGSSVSRSHRERMNQSSSKWREIFRPLPTCRKCTGDKQLVLGLLATNGERFWEIASTKRSPMRPTHPHQWGEFWDWVCEACEPEKFSAALLLYEERRNLVERTRKRIRDRVGSGR